MSAPLRKLNGSLAGRKNKKGGKGFSHSSCQEMRAETLAQSDEASLVSSKAAAGIAHAAAPVGQRLTQQNIYSPGTQARQREKTFQFRF
ncbi:MAG: hypothetical protein HY300_12485 [Verrucomicrobia bacterium]|nr:hypothetical protein [Verrucomicrobiota bacterium]